MSLPPPARPGGIQSDLIANDLAHEQSEAFVTVETYVPVAFDVKHEVTGVRPPVSNYGVIAIVCADGLQDIPLFLSGERSGPFERQRRMSLRHGLRVTTFANVRNGSISVLGFTAESGRWPPGRNTVAVHVS